MPTLTTRPRLTIVALTLLTTLANTRVSSSAPPRVERALIRAEANASTGIDPATGDVTVAADPRADERRLKRRLTGPATPLQPRMPKSARSPRSGSSAPGNFILRATIWGDPLFGALYDMDPVTAVLSNPRSTGLANLAGIASTADGLTTYLLRAHVSGNPATPVLFTVDVATGTPTELGAGGIAILIEGDLDFDPLSGTLYGTWELDRSAPTNSSVLLRFDTTTGAGLQVGTMFGVTDPHALAFDATGALYVLSRSPAGLHVVDPGTGVVLSSVALAKELDCAMGGIDFHPATGVLYAATAGTAGFPDCPNALWTVDTTTGDATLIGGTGALDVSGIDFVAIP